MRMFIKKCAKKTQELQCIEIRIYIFAFSLSVLFHNEKRKDALFREVKMLMQCKIIHLLSFFNPRVLKCFSKGGIESTSNIFKIEKTFCSSSTIISLTRILSTTRWLSSWSLETTLCLFISSGGAYDDEDDDVIQDKDFDCDGHDHGLHSIAISSGITLLSIMMVMIMIIFQLWFVFSFLYKIKCFAYESFSDVGEIRVYFASKILTPCRMHWNAFLIAQIIAKCHSFPNM